MKLTIFIYLFNVLLFYNLIIMNQASNMRIQSGKDEFIFNLNISSKYIEELIDIPKFIIIYDYYLVSSKLFLDFKKKVLSKLFQNLKTVEINLIQIFEQNYLKTFETNEFISSDFTQLFQLNIKETFNQLEELSKKNKSKFFNILVISNGNFEKTDENYINEIILKISKKIRANVKIVKLCLSEKNNNNSYFNYFLKLNSNNEKNKIIDLNEKYSEENIYKELYDFYNHKNMESGWKITRCGNTILKLPKNCTKDIDKSNEEIFFANFNEFISSLSQRVAINKTLSNQISLRQNESIILFCKDLLNSCKNNKIRKSYEYIIKGLEKINNDKQISKLDNHKLSTYINKSVEKIYEEKNKNIKKNKGDKYINNIGTINNKILNKAKDKIIIDATKVDNAKIQNNFNNTNKLQQYKNIFNKVTSSTLYNNIKTKKIEESKNITKYIDKNNKIENDKQSSKLEDKSYKNENNESNISNNILSNDEISKLKINLSKSVKPPNGTIIAIIDASRYMKNYMKDLINLLYNLLKKLNFKEKEKIYFLGYNSEDIEENFIPISKLSKLDIETEGERDISEVLNKVYDILKNNNGKNFRILFFTSGKLYKKNLSLSKSNLFFYENETQKIKVQVIKYYINEQSVFDKDDENILDMLSSINSKGKNKSITVDATNSISENIYKILKNNF